MGSFTEEVYQGIYDQILDGTLEPGAKIPIAQLAKKFGVGLSPVREALARLTATNLVIPLSQRGFIVAPFSLEEFNDIYTTRVYVEKLALSLSIEKGDTDWEANLIAAFHRLSHIEQKTIVSTLEEYKNWETQHRAFNLALIAACGLKHLLKIQEKLYLETERYRRIWFLAGLKKHKVLQFSLHQKQIMDAALARDSKKSLLLLEQHFDNAKKMISNYLSKKK